MSLPKTKRRRISAAKQEEAPPSTMTDIGETSGCAILPFKRAGSSLALYWVSASLKKISAL